MPGRPNVILSDLSPEVLRHLQPVENDVELRSVLFNEDTDGEFLYFPADGAVISMVRTLESGASVEVGVVGYEGAAPIQTFLTGQPFSNEGIVQQPGRMTRVRSDRLRAEAARDPAVGSRMMGYAASFLEQVSQNGVCNRLHHLEERLAKWLLMMRDRAASTDLQVTHEFLSHMLGVRRSGVTTAVNALTQDSLIAHRRSGITLLDLDGLKARACECTPIMQTLFDRSLGVHASRRNEDRGERLGETTRDISSEN